MPGSMWKPAVLAAVVMSLSLWSGAARAQDFETTHPYAIDPNKPHPVLAALHVHLPLTCWASHNGYSCGSFRSEATFLFGSCRQFYGDPCLKGPPPPPWSPESRIPPGAAGAAGAGDGAAPGRGCNCGW